MSGKSSRTKGHSFERFIANELKAIFPNAKRQLEYQIDSCKGVDLSDTGKFKIQCKKHKSYVSIGTIAEVKCDRANGDIPMLITAGDRKEPIAALYLSDLIPLLKQLKDKAEPPTAPW
jgi:hypothetical protein